jgi:hypothetical protein
MNGNHMMCPKVVIKMYWQMIADTDHLKHIPFVRAFRDILIGRIVAAEDKLRYCKSLDGRQETSKDRKNALKLAQTTVHMAEVN